MCKGKLLIAAVLVLLSIQVEADDNLIRDYYAEPGINPFRDRVNDHFNEHVDPFSGGLQLTFTDLVIPGNGGFDLHINRVYNHPHDELPPYTPYGIGWTMHFGRIVVAQNHADRICTQNQWAVNVLDNPSLELPDGGRHLLVLADYHQPYLISRNWWRADCFDGGQSVLVVSPDGTEYRMTERHTIGGETSLYATRITDANGNRMDITYDVNPSGYIYIEQVSTNDGRLIDYSYTDLSGDTIRLESITANGQTWQYSYSQVPELLVPYQQLTTVTRPDGTSWQYNYYGHRGDGSAGSFALQQMTYPWGGTATYDYDYVYFDPSDGIATTVLAEKQVGGRDIQPGTWTYTYTPGWATGFGYDETWISGPDKSTSYLHFGYSAVGAGDMWAVGLLYIEEVYTPNGDVTDQIVYHWNATPVSNESYRHGRDTLKTDPTTLAPFPIYRRHYRDQRVVETHYQNHDAYGQPTRMVRTASFSEEPDRITDYSYRNTPSTWILGLVEEETLFLDDGSTESWTITRDFDAAGNLLLESEYGVETTFTYTAAGDLATETDALGNTVTYANYHRGIPGMETHPEGVTILRTINNTGTVASETDGRGHTRDYTWDGLNRLTGITYPFGMPVSVSYAADGTTLTRGSYREVQSWDGMRRVIGELREDTALGFAVETTRQYDAAGRMVFESYPGSAQGTSYSYDEVDRIVQESQPGGVTRTYQYPAGNIVDVLDENGQLTTHGYLAVGEMDNRVLEYTLSPEDVATVIYRDARKEPVAVFQGSLDTGGFFRDYEYDSRGFLINEVHPETGVTAYGRDAVGNMTSRQIGQQGVLESFSYDGLNRLTSVTYDDGTDAVHYGYDENDNLTSLENGNIARAYVYDANDNLIEETLSIDGRSYDIAYGINGLDHVQSITYPSGRAVDFAPNALGWETQAGAYASQIQHHPTGLLQSLTLGNGAVTTVDLDARQRVAAIATLATAAGPVVDLTYSYDNWLNGTGIADGIDPTRNRNMLYDGITRLEEAEGEWGTEALIYDHRGNINVRDINGAVQEYYYSGNRLSFRVLPNVAFPFTYDPRGNVTGDGINTYTYDGAGNMVSASTAQGLLTYRYDGEGLQVQRGNTDMVHAHNGLLLGEYDVTGGFREYILVGTQLVARINDEDTVVATTD
ncbi:MAG: hypothetical protein LAT50_16385 [Ectothiorhodospiraceae bacterium]|nr:hypothetical protein [Ectothiorhodospiraceae bacterium]